MKISARIIMIIMMLLSLSGCINSNHAVPEMTEDPMVPPAVVTENPSVLSTTVPIETASTETTPTETTSTETTPTETTVMPVVPTDEPSNTIEEVSGATDSDSEKKEGTEATQNTTDDSVNSEENSPDWDAGEV